MIAKKETRPPFLRLPKKIGAEPNIRLSVDVDDGANVLVSGDLRGHFQDVCVSDLKGNSPKAKD